ncbi:MAG: DUF362 domain-containing protein [Candidatus Zixiibacteriota bacterium]|nr:MAG: DUF362 domain-containing protein [candidate division Zixibacteria bacterium]
MGFFQLPAVSNASTDSPTASGYERGVRQALDRLGGLEKFVSPGQKVLLKPDLMFDYPAGSTLTTDPEFIAATARLIAAAGAHVVVGDSPFVIHSSDGQFWRITGMAPVAKREAIELVSFEMAGSHAVAIDTRVYYISRVVMEADVVVSLPILKPDSDFGFAGGIRNMFGALPGFQKGRLYKKAANSRELARVLVDVFSAVRPALTIMQIPANDHPDPTVTGFVMASADAVALDSVITETLGMNPEKIHTTRLASDAGLGIGWIEAVRIEGEPLDALRSRLPLTSVRGRAAVLRGITRGMVEPYVWMKSRVDEELCDGCGACVSFCPTNALRFERGSSCPTIKADLCIHCWAGYTNCPVEAIHIEQSKWTRRLFCQSAANPV